MGRALIFIFYACSRIGTCTPRRHTRIGTWAHRKRNTKNKKSCLVFEFLGDFLRPVDLDRWALKPHTHIALIGMHFSVPESGVVIFVFWWPLSVRMGAF